MQTDRRQTLAHFGLVVQFIFALLQFENGSCVHTLSVATTISNTERNSPFVLLFVFESKLSGRCNVVEYKYYSNIHGYISVVTVELIVLRSFGFWHPPTERENLGRGSIMSCRIFIHWKKFWLQPNWSSKCKVANPFGEANNGWVGKKFCILNEIRSFSIIFARPHHLTLSWTEWIQCFAYLRCKPDYAIKWSVSFTHI